ncbi:DUF418 domain-containing protein [Streptomyces luteireticuli]|uniref:DUF418 domain-containing protein n=1 Tax=Streptomyces luteireticuli TaxID=173858 RepID=UPI0031D8D978
MTQPSAGTAEKHPGICAQRSRLPPPADTAGPAHRTGSASAGRLLGVDLARGLAVFGMYAAHVGPRPSAGGAIGFLMELSHGRASALFALLAGFTVVVITGRSTPKTGVAGRQAVAKVVIRAAVLVAAGTALAMTDPPVDVILAFYGVYFLLVLPLHRLRAGQLALIATAAAIVFPQVLYALAQMTGGSGYGNQNGADDVFALLVGGSYPAITWVPFVIAGMTVGRLDLARTAVRVRLAVAGVCLAVVGHGGSWLALRFVPGAARALADVAGPGAASAWWSDSAGYPTYDTPAWLLAASPHSETTLSIVGGTGVAIAVLALCLMAVDTVPRLRAPARPVIAVGSMSLTAYVLHFGGIWLLDIEEAPGSPMPVLLGFVGAATVFAVIWSRFFRRGPLEWLVYRVANLARYVP